MKIVAVLLPSAAFILTYLFLVECIKYRTGVLAISRRRFRLRLAAWLVAVALCGALFVGLFLLPRSYAHHHPLGVLILWMGCLVATFALIGIMYADVKEVEAGVREREKELWRGFARDLAEKDKPKE